MGGGDKPLLTVGTRSMLELVIAAIGLPHIAISANGDPRRFARFGLPVLDDGPFAGQGPLAGILAGLAWARSLGMTALLTAPGDTPFLPAGLAERLSPPPCSVASNGRRHHLVALWPVTVYAALHKLLSEPGSRSVVAFSQQIDIRYVDFPVPVVDPFENVNTLEQLTRARAIIGQVRTNMA
jgi:molybdopterin-guanine dinucleotide biosynthesis protein A